MDIKKFLSDDLFIYWRIHPTEELSAFWEMYLKKHEDKRELFSEAIIAFDAIRDERDELKTDSISIKQKIHFCIKEQKRRKSLKIFTASAAAVFLVAIASTLFLFHRSKVEADPAFSSIGSISKQDQIQLFTGSDILDIHNNTTISLNRDDQRAIIEDSLSRREIDLDIVSKNRLLVPYGKRTSIVLADSTIVHLNSGTTLEFPSSFVGDTREIHMEGEIYIEVANQSKEPFIIHTPNSRITVFGTSFNVSSYADEEKEAVVLVEGSVEVKSKDSNLLLKPSEKAEIINGTIQKFRVDVDEYISWKSGYLQFHKSPLDEVLRKIGRYYNVEFYYNKELNLSDRTCSGKLFLSDNLEDVLNSFSKMTQLKYGKERDKIISIEI